MIRFNKSVKLLEWGEGTNTTNQIWTEFATGKFISRKCKDGITTLSVTVQEPVKKKNEKNDAVKLTQVGEGMTACSEHWGEVATGQIKSMTGNTILIEIPYAVKISGAAGAFAKFLGLP